MFFFFYLLKIIYSLNPGELYNIAIDGISLYFIIGYNNEATIGYTGFTPAEPNPATKEDLTIPSTIELNGEVVTFVELFPECFKGSQIKRFYLPRSIKTIGQSAFEASQVEIIDMYECSTWPISSKCFFNCEKLVDIRFPEYLDSLGESCLEGCVSLENLFLDETHVTKLEKNAFKGCTSLLVLRFPPTINSIGDYCFSECSFLPYFSLDGTSIASIGIGCFESCTSLMEAYMNDTQLTVLPDALFVNCQYLTTLTLPKKLEEIGATPFVLTNIDELYIPETVSSLGAGAFSFMLNLKFLDLSKIKATTLPTLCFRSSGLERLFLNQDIQESFLLECTYLKEIIFSKKITNLPNLCFESCTSLQIIQYNEDPQVNSSNIDNEYWPCDFTAFDNLIIGEQCFSGCTSLKTIKFGTISQIGSNLFQGCTSLINISLIECEILTTIDGNLFTDCSSLKYLFLPNTIESIASTALPTSSSTLNSLNNIQSKTDLFNYERIVNVDDKLTIIIVNPSTNEISYDGDTSNIIFLSNKQDCSLGSLQSSSITHDILMPDERPPEIFETPTPDPEIPEIVETPARSPAENDFTPEFRFPPETNKTWIIVIAIILGVILLGLIGYIVFSFVYTFIQNRNIDNPSKPQIIFEV